MTTYAMKIPDTSEELLLHGTNDTNYIVYFLKSFQRQTNYTDL